MAIYFFINAIQLATVELPDNTKSEWFDSIIIIVRALATIYKVDVSEVSWNIKTV
jgi:hypothetical protein